MTSYKIIEAKYLKDYKISLIFNNKTEKIIDFYDLLKNTYYPNEKKYLNINKYDERFIEEIIKIVSSQLAVKISDIKAHNKNKNLVAARQIVMYLARKLTKASFPDIGQKIGGRDHSTVIYANNKIINSIESDSKFKSLIKEIENNLLNKA